MESFLRTLRQRKKTKEMKIDIRYENSLNNSISNKGTIMFEEVKNKLESLLNGVQDAQNAINTVAEAPNVEKAIVEALVAALEAQGYTVTAPTS